MIQHSYFYNIVQDELTPLARSLASGEAFYPVRDPRTRRARRPSRAWRERVRARLLRGGGATAPNVDPAEVPGDPSGDDPLTRPVVASTRSPMRNVTAGSAPGGTSSPFTATASTEKNSDARDVATSSASSSAPSAATSASLSLAPSGSSRTRTRPSTAATTYTGAGAPSVEFGRRPARVALERLAESALTSGESHVDASRASPRGRPKGALSSWLGHSGSCVGKGHGHGHGTQSVSDASSRAAAAANRSRSNRAPPAHVVARSCPASSARIAPTPPVGRRRRAT